jgi:carbamoylphosphate synthase large subunit
MKTIAAFAIGAALTWTITHNQTQPEPEVHVITEVEERLITHEILTTLDIEEVREQVAELEQLLHDECIAIIHWRTEDPIAGIEHHVNRHYNGDACQAAEDALHDRW